jgi:EmrB/QacA subfamily drug resistance transporter
MTTATATTGNRFTNDPKRWAGLVVLSMSLFIIVLDNTILNVAVPTIIRDLHTNVSAVQWVISGYALIFASLLISFGRIGDIIGRRKMFFIGASLFAVGSLIASESHSVVQLFIGESILEGIGAAAMLPATLAIISATFRGRERGIAFAVWGAVAGGAGALGPWLGGILTTDYSWRWAFRINVIVAPIVIIAAIFLVGESKDERARGFDPFGVVLVTAGLLGLVFGIIEAGRYGWLSAISGTKILGLSPVPWSILVGLLFLLGFVFLELARAGVGKPVIFDFRDLVHRGFRYGLINTVVLAMGEFGAFFLIPLFLQSALHISALTVGTWLLPAGIAVFVGGGIGGALSHRFGPKYVITAGLVLEATGIWMYTAAFGPTTDFWSLFPALILHGIGVGFATSQLTNVVLSDIPPQKAGSASGASGMMRQVGTALGIAVIGAIYVSRSGSNISDNLAQVRGLPATVQSQIRSGVTSSQGAAGRPKSIHAPAAQVREVQGAITAGFSDAASAAMSFAGIVVTLGALISLLVPNIPPDEERQIEQGEWAGAAAAD